MRYIYTSDAYAWCFLSSGENRLRIIRSNGKVSAGSQSTLLSNVGIYMCVRESPGISNLFQNNVWPEDIIKQNLFNLQMYKIFITFSFSSISAKIYKYDVTIIIKKESYNMNWHTKYLKAKVFSVYKHFIYSHLYFFFSSKNNLKLISVVCRLHIKIDSVQREYFFVFFPCVLVIFHCPL